MIVIDGCQYANWPEKIIREINDGGDPDIADTAVGLRMCGFAGADVVNAMGGIRQRFFETSLGGRTE